MNQTPISREQCDALDLKDPLASFINEFQAPQKNTIFLDANSMGAMPKNVPQRLNTFFTDAWVELRRQGWNHFEWMERPHQIGESIAHLIGAGHDEVIACDNTTINLFKMVSYAWRVSDSGKRVITEKGNFPTDLYVVEGLGDAIKGEPEVTRYETREDLLAGIDDTVSVIYLSHVDYRTGERWDMQDINRRAHEVGAVTVWDLSHSTGAIPVDLNGTDADYAVGCGYKYLSGGPGGSAYLWAHKRHASKAWPTICGWMGHADVFAFATDYAPHDGVQRQATGTPAVIANEVFACAAEIWRNVDAKTLWAKHEALGNLLIDLLEQECGSLGVTVNSPRKYAKRGGHVGFSHPGAGPICEALLEAGVVGSFRKPNALRFGIGALYTRYSDIWEAVARLKQVLENEVWREARFQKVSV